MSGLDAIDRKLIEATQAGLPIEEEPFKAVATRIGTSQSDVISRFERLIDDGVVRRIGAAPNHYVLGLHANGMTVWDVDDDCASAKGREVGALDFVSHCYLRPRSLPDWPFNLFAMVHGRTREEVEGKRAVIADLLGASCQANDILYSTRILKKTGLRLARTGG